jgi:exodeoxyribonuclease VII small subunit
MSETVADEPSFEQSLLRLEQLVRELEDGRLGLEESLDRYEQGVGLIKRCQARLRQAEQRIQMVAGVDEAGGPILQPFPHESTAAVRADPVRRPRKKSDPPE